MDRTPENRKRLISKRPNLRTTETRLKRRRRRSPVINIWRINSPVIDSSESETDNENTEITNCTQPIQTNVDGVIDHVNLIFSDEEENAPEIPNTPSCNNSNAAEEDSVITLIEEQSANLPGTSETNLNKFDNVFDDIVSIKKSLIDFRKQSNKLIKKTSSIINNFKNSNSKKVTVKEIAKASECPKGPSCPICLEGLPTKRAVATFCGHLFCKKCIDKSIKETKRCPICNNNLSMKNYLPVYL